VVGEGCAAGTDCVGSDCALLRKQTESNETFGQFAVRLFPYEFISGVTPPKIDTGALKKFASDPAEKLNQGIWIRAFRRFLGDAQKEVLKGNVGVDVDPPGGALLRWRSRIASSYVQNVTACRRIWWFSQVIESNGKVPRHLILSQVKWGNGVPKCEIPRINGGVSLSLRKLLGRVNPIAWNETALM
jgi:hypothetical protein